MSSVSETATCPTTSALRIVKRRIGPPSAFSFLIVSTTVARVACSAGKQAEQHAGDRRCEQRLKREHAPVERDVDA